MRSGILLAVVLGGTSGVVADTIHVPGDFLTIQEAIVAAVDGDEVEVHPDTYFETINFLGKAIRVYSTDGPDVTIIDAQQTGTVVTCDSAEGPDSVLEGFTITNGLAELGGGMRNANSSPTVTNCTFSGNDAAFGVGGGMFNEDGSPTVTNCTFSGNTAFGDGGGMYNFFSSPTVTNCTFSGNSATVNGGGMINSGSSLTLINCTFSGNTAVNGGGMANQGISSTVVTNCTFSGNSATVNGGGMINSGSSLTLTNCTFSGNTAVNGGGMANQGISSTVVTNCTFTGNSATVGGGGMINSGGSPTVTNCTFSGNSANAFGGGGMFNVNSTPMVTNCTFSENTTMRSGGGMLNINPGSPMVTNCILWGDSPDEISGPGMVTVSYSDVQGGWAGVGNIDVDPLFVDPNRDDYRLLSGSPCIDAGNNWGVPVDVNDYDEDGTTCELFPVDLDGNPRFNADENDFDPGCGVPVVVDMGAYEYQFDPADQITFADLNGDDAVGVKDLLGLLGSWGLCGKGCCLADLDINGSVGVPDLLALLGNWGPCP